MTSGLPAHGGAETKRSVGKLDQVNTIQQEQEQG